MSITTKAATEGLYRFASRTPFNIAPERGEELAKDIFGSGNWEIRPSNQAATFAALPSEKAIYLSYAGLANLWCIAYVAFHVMDLAGRQQRAKTAPDQTEIDISKEFAALRLPDYVTYAESLFRVDQPWPTGLATPQPDADFSSLEGRVNNVFFGALSWIILHEIAHVHHEDDRFIPATQRVSQEYRADAFATEWVLHHAGAGLSREFRVLMICVALAWLFLNERTLGKGSDHPPTILRFRECVHLFEMGERSAALENAAYTFKALFDAETAAPEHNTPKEFFEWVCTRLEAIFPAN